MASIVSRSGLDVARAAFFEKLYRGKSVLCVGLGDGTMLDVLLARGAARVAGVDIDESVVQAAQQRLGERVALKTGLLREAASLGAPFDLVLVRRGETMVARDLWRDVARLVRTGGWLVAAALAGDRDDAPRGAMRYQQLRDHTAAYFPQVTMLAQSSFAGTKVIPFGDVEVEPVLDTAMADASPPELYLAVAGPDPLALPYGLIELPDTALEGPGAPQEARPPAAELDKARAQAAEIEELRAVAAEVDRLRAQAGEAARRAAQLAERDERLRKLEGVEAAVEELRRSLAERERRLAAAESDRDQLRSAVADREARLDKAEAERRALLETQARRAPEPAPGAGAGELFELREQLALQTQALEAARGAALVHAEEMRGIEAVLAERDAYLAELEGEVRALHDVRESARRASSRAEEVEARERGGRRRVAELEGTLLRLQAGGAALPPGAGGAGAESSPEDAMSGATHELRQQVVELEARCARLQQKADEAQREAWAHLKARSDAEAAAAEVREDTVRKLKDARKFANVELMRAMEEATRKAVMLKEELVRAERERKEALSSLQAAQAELERERAALGERLHQTASEEASRVLGGLEERVVQAEAERDRFRESAEEAQARSSAHAAAAAAAVEVERLLGGIGRALSVESARLASVEEGLSRALGEMRGGGEGNGSPAP